MNELVTASRKRATPRSITLAGERIFLIGIFLPITRTVIFNYVTFMERSICLNGGHIHEICSGRDSWERATNTFTDPKAQKKDQQVHVESTLIRAELDHWHSNQDVFTRLTRTRVTFVRSCASCSFVIFQIGLPNAIQSVTIVTHLWVCGYQKQSSL